MTKLYLIRHGEAEGNLYRRAQGQYNSNITALGRVQLGALAERFRDVPLDALWSSDLNRTRSTAAAIRKYHPALELNLSPRLREIDVGVWEDVAWGNIAADYPEQMELFTHDPGRWSVSGGEPFAALTARMKAAVLELGKRYEGKSVAVVTHGLAIRALLCDLYGIPSARIDEMPYGDNTSVTLLTAAEGKLNVEFCNDASHLQEAGLSTFSRQSWREKEKQGLPAKRIYTRFEPLDPETEGELYTRCYAETWRASHGSLSGFSPVIYLRNAILHAGIDPRCLVKLYQGDRFAGLVELDPERGREDGCGWISLLYVEPELRGGRLGVQLVGHAVSVFRREGRTGLRLHTAEENTAAVGFYEHNGFRRAGRTEGVRGPLYLMEMDIAPRVLEPEDI